MGSSDHMNIHKLQNNPPVVCVYQCLDVLAKIKWYPKALCRDLKQKAGAETEAKYQDHLFPVVNREVSVDGLIIKTLNKRIAAPIVIVEFCRNRI